MSSLGVHFALTDGEVAALRGMDDEQERLAYLTDDIEERYLAEPATWAAESDKAWDAIHRVLSDGGLSWAGGSYPLNHAVLGGEPLYTGVDYVMSLKGPAQVRDIAAALQSIDKPEFRARYWAIDPASYGRPLDEENLEYAWSWFQSVRDLYRRAAAEGRYVLFTVDQ